MNKKEIHDKIFEINRQISVLEDEKQDLEEELEDYAEAEEFEGLDE